MDPMMQEKLQAVTRFNRSQSTMRAVTRAVAFAVMLATVLFYCKNNSDSNLSLSQTLRCALDKASKEVMFLLCNIIMLLVLRDSGLIGPFQSSNEVNGEPLKAMSTSDVHRTWRTEVSQERNTIVDAGEKVKEQEVNELEEEEEEEEEEEDVFSSCDDGDDYEEEDDDDEEEEEEEEASLSDGKEEEEEEKGESEDAFSSNGDNGDEEKEKEEEESDSKFEEFIEKFKKDRRGEREDAYSSDEVSDRKFEEFIEKFKKQRRQEALQLVLAR